MLKVIANGHNIDSLEMPNACLIKWDREKIKVLEGHNFYWVIRKKPDNLRVATLYHQRQLNTVREHAAPTDRIVPAYYRKG